MVLGPDAVHYLEIYVFELCSRARAEKGPGEECGGGCLFGEVGE